LSGVRVTFLKIEPIFESLKRKAEELVKKNRAVCEVDLFGSLATGTYGPWSDADILILLEKDNRRFIDRIPEFINHFDGCGLTVDVFPYTLEEWNKCRDEGFFKTVDRERIVLVGR